MPVLAYSDKRFTAYPLNAQQLQHLRSGRIKLNASFDENCCIFLHDKQLRQLHLKLGVWVMLEWNSNSYKRERYARVYSLCLFDTQATAQQHTSTSQSLDNETAQPQSDCGHDDSFSSSIAESVFSNNCDNCESNEILMSERLLFNFKPDYEKWKFPNDTTYFRIKKLQSDVPKQIESINFSLVRSPDYPGNLNYNQLLASYLNKEERYLEKDDIVSILLNRTLLNDMPADKQLATMNVHFKVTNATPEDGRFVFKKTKLLLTGHTNSYVPSDGVLTKRDFLQGCQFIRPIMQTQLDELKKKLLPCLAYDNISNLFLLSGGHGTGKRYLIKQVAAKLHLNLYEVEADMILHETLVGTEKRLEMYLTQALNFKPCILLIGNFDLLVQEFATSCYRFSEKIQQMLQTSGEPIILIAATANSERILKSDFSTLFTNRLSVSSLTELDRRDILNCLADQFDDLKFNGSNCLLDDDLLHFVKLTQNFCLGDLIGCFARTISQLRSRPQDEIAEATSEKMTQLLFRRIFEQVQKEMQRLYSKSIDAPLVPNVKWKDVGGLQDAKKVIRDTIELPLLHPSLFCNGFNRTGLLFWGPPGTGKTLLAKAIATEFKLNFLSVKGPEVINMYVGQSEENLRMLFKKAQDAAPCVVFFDELDSIAPNRGRSGDSGGVMDRLVSTLLAEMDNLNQATSSHKPGHQPQLVFIIGATNRPDLLDPGLLRPGRLDQKVFIDLPRETDARLKVLKALTRKFVLESGCSINTIEKKCPANMSGADFSGLCSAAMMEAIKRKISLLENAKKANNSQSSSYSCKQMSKFTVGMKDFEAALKCVRPSLTQEDIARYEMIKMRMNKAAATEDES